MDESHRLLPMKENYDEKLFNELYKKCTPLMKKLAYEIDSRKFGVEYQEILSWFKVKFIFAFNKYFEKEPERLLGYIINSLQMYKYRIMRSSYQAKYHDHASQIDITELRNYENIVSNEGPGPRDLFLEVALGFLQNRLSKDALLILELELEPPDYIRQEMIDLGKSLNTKIPDDVIADFLGFNNSQAAVRHIRNLRDEIKAGVKLAKEYFQANPNLIPAEI